MFVIQTPVTYICNISAGTLTRYYNYAISATAPTPTSPPGGATSALVTDKVDIVISVMGLTPERAKQIMFTSPYADTKLAVFGPKSADVPSADKIGSLFTEKWHVDGTRAPFSRH